LNGAFGMGSYLQGFSFIVMRKHMTAMLGLTEERASRLRRKSWVGGKNAPHAETFDTTSFIPHLGILNIYNKTSTYNACMDSNNV